MQSPSTIEILGIRFHLCYTGIMKKQCQMCNKTKSVSVFHKSKVTKDGYSSYCSPCKVECNRKSESKRLSENRENHLRQRKNNHLKTMYKITIDDYDIMHTNQKGLCAICLKPETQAYRRLAVDHCHKKNKVRALLCYGCNRGLGSFLDNPTSLRNAAAYLENWY